MSEEKIRCTFCGRRNHIDNDLCDSCGAWLLEPIKHASPYPVLEMDYLNALVKYSAFTYRDGQLVGVR
jgi:hypothetical protein